jgi:hypothetical protein
VVAEAAVDLLGSDVEASTAILMAMSKSHSLELIVESILTARLGPNGNIVVGVAGSSRSPFTAVAPREELCLNPDDEFDCNSEIDDRLEDWESLGRGEFLTGVILRAAARGYDEEQITAALSASLLGTTGDVRLVPDGTILDCSIDDCFPLGASRRIVCLFTEIDAASCRTLGLATTTSLPAGTTDSGQAPAADPDGDIRDGTYTGTADPSSDFGAFFSDLNGVAATDRMTVVVEGGTVTSFEIELSGTGASNLNVATGERLCENPLSVTASFSNSAPVVIDGNTAEVPTTFRFLQEVGAGPECYDDSNVEIDQVFDDIATIVFIDTTATASLTAGFGGEATLTD